MTITIEMALAFVAGYAVRCLFGAIYREGLKGRTFTQAVSSIKDAF